MSTMTEFVTFMEQHPDCRVLYVTRKPAELAGWLVQKLEEFSRTTAFELKSLQKGRIKMMHPADVWATGEQFDMLVVAHEVMMETDPHVKHIIAQFNTLQTPRATDIIHEYSEQCIPSDLSVYGFDF